MLHEIGFIKNKYRDERDNIQNTRINGVVWVRKDAELPAESGNVTVDVKEDGIYVNGLNLLKELALGGDLCLCQAAKRFFYPDAGWKL